MKNFLYVDQFDATIPTVPGTPRAFDRCPCPVDGKFEPEVSSLHLFQASADYLMKQSDENQE